MEAISQSLDKSIFERQNDDILLRCLVTQRKEYSRAKRKMKAKRYLVVCSAVVSTLAACSDNENIIALAGLLAVMVPIVSRKLDRKIEQLKKAAAGIQQYIDASLFAPALHIQMASFGPFLPKSDIAEIVSKNFAAKDLEAVKNWYQNYAEFPAPMQVYYCQRENIQWDNNLRENYETFQNIWIGIACFLILVLGLWTGMTVAKFLSILAWGASLIDYLWENHEIINADLQRLKEMRRLCSAFENEGKKQSDQQAQKVLIDIQKKIREHRERAFLIPDMFYKLLKKRHQEQMERYSDTVRHMNGKQ